MRDERPSNNDLLTEVHYSGEPPNLGKYVLNMGLCVAKYAGMARLGANLKSGEYLSGENLFMVAVAGTIMTYELLRDGELIIWQTVGLIGSLIAGAEASSGSGLISGFAGGIAGIMGLLEGVCTAKATKE